MKSIVCTLLMLLSSGAALKIAAKPYQPELVQLLSVPGQGSTALSQLLMSSKNVATLCSGQTWQCEPCNFMDEASELCEGIGSDVNVLRNAMDTWALHWDLSRPLLMKKAMFDVVERSVLETHRMYLQMAASGLPQRMRGASIDGLRFAYIVLWRPFCLSKMSSHFSGVPSEVENLEYLGNIVENLPRETGARVLVINYGSLLWDMEKTKKRVEAFLPEAGLLDTSFEPRMDIDVFPGNLWKATGSISEYAQAHQSDAATLGYNVLQQTCESEALSEYFPLNPTDKNLRARYGHAVDILRAKSM
mmetsp:Transcript_154890/g.281647  ORF Transcript_154890/g.281647 Transcript_154890/m.281647 type:complete len:304 (-) Transcript_154890:240-1151(-)